MRNTADVKQVKNAERKAKEERKQELSDIRVIMSTPEGRRFFYRLINVIGHYDALSAHNSGSMTFMLEGERNIARVVKGDIYEAAFTEWQLMEKEMRTANLTAKGLENMEEKQSVKEELDS